MPERIRIAVVDDHPLFRAGVVFTLQSAPDMMIVAEGATAYEAVQIGRSHAPDIMLLDVSMPGGGIEAASELRLHCPLVKAVMLTVSENASHVSSALQSGVSAYVVKGCSGPELLRIVRGVQNCESYITPALAARLLTQPKTPRVEPGMRATLCLTQRENQVLQLLSEGLMNKEIAYKLRLTEKTVKHYMTELMQKLNVRNRVEAVLITRRQAEANSTNLTSFPPDHNGAPGVPIVPS
jgi:two-component system, NarL family, nitrate/nitrite response regulator NarL